ncbi:hypothetical protein ElyMa_005111700 [Elysia marginata]|uniref:Uncharacterized protein n=1 Tax=Elysia marginata TaxID=1093978 RepID=A0AAV4JLD6_9GAST|nr:hypothetical protein ElyMa_005111700 [Elysia marginata]
MVGQEKSRSFVTHQTRNANNGRMGLARAERRKLAKQASKRAVAKSRPTNATRGEGEAIHGSLPAMLTELIRQVLHLQARPCDTILATVP